MEMNYHKCRCSASADILIKRTSEGEQYRIACSCCPNTTHWRTSLSDAIRAWRSHAG